MIFVNIANWSKKKLIAITILCESIYLMFALVCPMVTIMIKYHVFSKKPSSLSGTAIFLIVFFGILGIRYIKKLSNKLPQVTRGEQLFKFNIQMILPFLLPILILVVMYLFRSDFKLAYSTFKICFIFFMCGIIFDYTFIKYIEAEWNINSRVEMNKEVIKRKDR